ncbi:uncharacterized protein LOC132178051 [Corylus avellana]|uniref:uncharacterized protein LOC132178051 n=1 Tax=Corylus avellana TaxID=13451 RepID=UPI002869FF71|nr:uncharacterized protein LOC132178051 [Corylus avellana]
MIDEGTSYHQQLQAITTLRSDKIVDNHVEEKKDEHTEVAQNLQNDKRKQVSNEASSSAASTPENPYEPRAPFPECLKAPSHFGKQGEKVQSMMEMFKQVDKFFFPVDFIVLDTKPVPNPEKLVLVILGRPFLATANACINCRTGVMEISFSNMKVRLNIFFAFQHAPDQNECFFVESIEDYVEDSLPSLLTEDPVEACLTYFDFEEFNTDQYIEEVHELLDTAASADFHPWRVVKEPLPVTSSTPHVPSLLSPPKLELTPLPEKLKYAFLEANNTLLVIIVFDLQKDQEDSLLAVLKEHKEAIGWTVADLKGIDPSICMQRIHLEKDARPSREAQRRLNPNMKEVVMKEVVKLVDAGIIYPISDSKWVSPTQVVPKKSGITVVENSSGELVPQHTTTRWRVCIDY